MIHSLKRTPFYDLIDLLREEVLKGASRRELDSLVRNTVRTIGPQSNRMLHWKQGFGSR